MSHFLFIFHIDKNGKGRELTPEEFKTFKPKGGYFWVHMDANNEATHAWMENDPDIDKVAERTLLAKDARPRTIAHEDNILINLRGVNLNPGSQPEDMIGIRFYVEPDRITSAERRPLKATADIATRAQTQIMPETPGGFLAYFAMILGERMAPTITNLNEQVDTLEENVDGQVDLDDSRSKLSELRRQAIMLRRYLAPQRDALNTLALQNVKWITNDDRLRVREAADGATRVNEELEAVRERCAIVKDQLADQRAEEMNRNMMILSVVAAIFLPLGLISGMFGINVSGMPWTEGDMGFWIVTGIVVAIAAILLAVFRWAKWI